MESPLSPDKDSEQQRLRQPSDVLERVAAFNRYLFGADVRIEVDPALTQPAPEMAPPDTKAVKTPPMAA